MTRFGTILIALLQWLLSIILFWCLWKLLTLHREVLMIRFLLLTIPTGILAVYSFLSGYWLIRRKRQGWYASNVLGIFIFSIGVAIAIWNEMGLPLQLQESGGAGALGLIMIACLLFSAAGLVFLNLPQTRRMLNETTPSAQD